jgi:hypothetical protein
MSLDGEEEWIRARAALELLDGPSAARTICKRANAGLIKARAERFIRDGEASDDVDVPTEFWWAEGGQALIQNWETGDFETWWRQAIHLQAFGVRFRRSDIEKLRPDSPAAALSDVSSREQGVLLPTHGVLESTDAPPREKVKVFIGQDVQKYGLS